MLPRTALVGVAPSLLWLLLWCPLERALAGDKKARKKKDEDSDKKVALPHHSFAVPLAYEEFLGDWAVSGASLAERERLLLHPSVSERAAFVWSKQPLKTNDFEATVHLRVVGPKGLEKAPVDQSFAVWYVEENVTAGYNDTDLIKAATWKIGMEEKGMTLSGAKAKFKGFGAVLSITDGKASPKSVISGIWNDGDRELKYGSDVPASNAKAIDFRNTMNAAQLRIRVTPTSIVGFFKQSPSLSWNECFNIDRSKEPLKPGGYIGFSAWSGTPGAEVVPDMVSIMQLEMYNFDTTSIGEEMKDVSKDIQEAYREMLTDEHRHFHDQKSQTEHIERLTTMLKQHAEANKPADEKLFQDLEGLQGRMGKLDEDCKTLTKELQVVVGGEGVGLSDHIIGLRRLFVKDSVQHKDKLEMVQKKMSDVKQKHIEASNPETFTKVIADSEKLQKTAVASSFQTLWMLLAIVVAIAIIGGLMYNRMHYYERKHFL